MNENQSNRKVQSTSSKSNCNTIKNLDQSASPAQIDFDTLLSKEKDKIFSIEQEVYLKDLIAKEIKGQLLDEVVAIFSRNIAKYTLNVSTATKRELDNSICLAISDDKLTNNDQSGSFIKI